MFYKINFTTSNIQINVTSLKIKQEKESINLQRQKVILLKGVFIEWSEFS